MLHILGATHCFVASLLAPPTMSRSLRSELVVFSSVRKKQRLSLLCSAAYSPRAASGPVGIGDSHPLQSMLIDVCLRRHQWRCSVPESPIPIARSNTIVLCKGNHIKIPMKIPTYWKMVSYPLIKEGQLSHKYAF